MVAKSVGPAGVNRLAATMASVVALLIAQFFLYRGYITDDTYIYARFARNLAQSGELVFNPGVAVHAVTSPVWALVGALGEWSGLGAPGVLRGAGMLVAVAATVVFLRIMRREGLSDIWLALAGAVFATEIWFVRWSASGMETALGVLAVLAIVDLGLRPRAMVPAWRLGLALGLAPFVRPELALLSVMVGARALTVGRFRWPVIAGAAVPVILWALYAIPTFGEIWPQTLQAKSTPIGLQPARLWMNLQVLGKLLLLAAPVPLVALMLVFRRSGSVAPDAWVRPVLWVWIVLLPAIYLVRDVQVVSRYLEVVLPVVLVLAASLAYRHSSHWRFLWAGQVALSLVLTITWVSPNARAFGRSLEAGLGDIAGWIDANTPTETTVASYDIGLVGYRSNRRILDLGGLIEPRINDLRNRVGDEEILQQGLFLEVATPQFLVHRDALPNALVDGGVAGLRLTPVLNRSVANLGLSRAEPVVYTLYRVESIP